jgi:hypothetical protein
VRQAKARRASKNPLGPLARVYTLDTPRTRALVAYRNLGTMARLSEDPAMLDDVAGILRLVDKMEAAIAVLTATWAGENLFWQAELWALRIRERARAELSAARVVDLGEYRVKRYLAERAGAR